MNRSLTLQIFYQTSELLCLSYKSVFIGALLKLIGMPQVLCASHIKVALLQPLSWHDGRRKVPENECGDGRLK